MIYIYPITFCISLFFNRVTTLNYLCTNVLLPNIFQINGYISRKFC